MSHYITVYHSTSPTLNLWHTFGWIPLSVILVSVKGRVEIILNLLKQRLRIITTRGRMFVF